jgi:hypothetical protein
MVLLGSSGPQISQKVSVKFCSDLL